MTILLRSPGGTYLAIRPPTAPDAPTGVSAVATDSTTIRVSWAAVTGATSYGVQRSADGSSGWSAIGTPSASPFDDTGRSAGDTWYYRIRGVNGAGNSDWAGPVSATIPPASLIKAQHANGQTFITRPDGATSSSGQVYRYNLYRSTTGEITQANLASATLLQTYIPNNSGQVFGGKPDTIAGQSFTSANRIDSAAQGSKLPDGTQVSLWTALAVHTCTATQNAYYAMLATNINGTVVETVSSGVNSCPFAISETALATTYPVPVLWASGASTGTRGTANLRISGTTNLPSKIILHASSSLGGTPGQNTNGDYLQFWGDSSMAYQDGVQTAWDVLEYHTSPLNQFWVSTRDTIWRPDWTAANTRECWHQGLGMRKSGDSTFKFYPFQHYRLLALIAYMKSHYVCDPNRIVMTGQSMGAWGSTLFGFKHPDLIAAVFPNMPSFRTYSQSAAGWPFILSPYPFNASANTSNPLGTNAAAVLMDDGTTPWGGTGGWADAVSIVSGTTADLPFFCGSLGRLDPYANWADFVAGITALETNKHGYACSWDNAGHTGTNGVVNIYKEQAGAKTWAKYSEFGFGLNRSYPAFSASSINDNIGTGVAGNGDLVGGRNVGFDWGTDAGATTQTITETSSTWSCKIINRFMAGTFPLGPVLGPFTTMTCSVTPRRRQTFLPSIGATVNYSYTPSGGSVTTGSVVVPASGQITIPGVVINSSGATAFSLSA